MRIIPVGTMTITNEMHAIHDRNLNQGGWSEFGFEPANEPNTEWYVDPGNQNVINRGDKEAWEDMDAYFGGLYDYVHQNYGGIRVLTPAMAQNALAEYRQFDRCLLQTLPGELQAGYEFMPSTYGNKNDGFSWHNYWRYDKEQWDNNFCPSAAAMPAGDHIFQYFPPAMQNIIGASNKPAFITEADLFSPCQGWNQPAGLRKNDDPSRTAGSLRQFMSAEAGADAAIGWLLTDGDSNSEVCVSGDEMAWHEAYHDDQGNNVSELAWFAAWWSGPE